VRQLATLHLYLPTLQAVSGSSSTRAIRRRTAQVVLVKDLDILLTHYVFVPFPTVLVEGYHDLFRVVLPMGV
jgi:hypothetical protein